MLDGESVVLVGLEAFVELLEDGMHPSELEQTVLYFGLALVTLVL